MKCSVCQKEDAKIHITQIKNNEKHAIHLCHACAQELGIGHGTIDTAFSVEDLLSGKPVVTDTENTTQSEAKVHGTCAACGLSYGAFLESGRLGCPTCYVTFSSQLMPLLRKVQKDIHYRGKEPVKGDEHLTLKREISDMRMQLKNAVSQENFEEAARLRDSIRHLEENLQQEFQHKE